MESEQLIYYMCKVTYYMCKVTSNDDPWLFKDKEYLTHISLAWDYTNSTDPDQTTKDTVSDQGLYCLLTECSIKS